MTLERGTFSLNKGPSSTPCCALSSEKGGRENGGKEEEKETEGREGGSTGRFLPVVFSSVGFPLQGTTQLLHFPNPVHLDLKHT